MKLVIVDEEPKTAPRMPESLKQQGHKFCKCIDVEGDSEPRLYHMTPAMLKDAVKEAPAPSKKAPAKKAATKKAATKKSK